MFFHWLVLLRCCPAEFSTQKQPSDFGLTVDVLFQCRFHYWIDVLYWLVFSRCCPAQFPTNKQPSDFGLTVDVLLHRRIHCRVDV
jgi:hypothetical protein